MRKDALRVGVIGLGKMGLLHTCILNVLPQIKLIAVCDKSGWIRRISKKVFSDIQLTDDVDKLAGLDLDAVYLTTPIPLHFPIAKIVYSKGIARNLFVEKTLASNFSQSKELLQLARSCGGINMVGYMKRFAVTFKKAKDLMSQKTLGNLVSFDAYAYSSDFSEVKKGSKVSASRGGVLEDLGSHVVDLALWLFGDLQVTSAELTSMNSPPSEDSAHFNVRKSSDFQGRFDVSWCRKEYRMPEFGLLIRGTNGTLVANDDEVRTELNNGESQKWYRHDLNDNVNFLLGAPEYYREDEYFADSVLNSRNVESDFQTASEVDFMLDQVRSKAGSKWVKINQ